MRTYVTPAAWGSQRDTSRFSEWFSQYHGFTTLILSDENISGNPRLLKDGALYEALERNCFNLRAILPRNAVLEVFFTIRDYGEFFASMYCEYLRHKDFCDFDSYLENSNYESISWVNVHSALASVFGKQHVHLYDFSDFATSGDKLIGALLPEGRAYTELPVDTNANIVRPTFSAAAIELLTSASGFLYNAQQRKLLKTILSYEVRNGLLSKKFSPLAGNKKLKRKYFDDVCRLQEMGAFEWLHSLSSLR